MKDGPGIRTVVFMKGCPLNCFWCHNPEMKKRESELLFYQNKCIGCGACVQVCADKCHSISAGHHNFCRQACDLCGKCAEACPSGAIAMAGKRVTVNQIVDTVELDSAFYGDNGGVTLSGGEPMAQPTQAIAMLRECKRRHIHTAVETCGYFPRAYIKELVDCTDLFLWDFKDSDPQRLLQNTGADIEIIKNNLSEVSDLGGRIRLRCIILHGINDNEEHYTQIARLFHSTKHMIAVELLAYHTYGENKVIALGGRANRDYERLLPSSETMDKAKEFLKNAGVAML